MISDSTDEWFALSRADRLRQIAEALEMDPTSADIDRLSAVPPSSWTTALQQRAAAREYGFPAEPAAGDNWTAWDTSVWTFSDGLPWWKLTSRPKER